MKLDKYDVALINATAKEPASKLLQCLHLSKGRIEAADGFMMARRELELEEGEVQPETLISAAMFKNIRPSKKQEALLATDNNSVTLTYRNAEDGQPVEFEPTLSFKAYGYGETFPNLDAQYDNSPTEKKAHIAVSVSLLKKLLACLPNEGILRIGINEVAEPMEYECSNMDRPIRGLIMPMFVDWSDFKWHRDNPKETATK